MRRARLYNIQKAAIWLDDPLPIIDEDYNNDYDDDDGDGGGGGVTDSGSDGGHVESRSLGLLTSSCWHVTRVASWSRDLSATVPRDDGDALHFKRRERRRVSEVRTAGWHVRRGPALSA